ncbi:MAG: threonine/serine exporter [Clostridiales bacterium]|nr:threonine/serine exporter [Clostridiales bacterium]
MMKNVLFAAIAATSIGILFNVQRRNLLFAGINGGLGYLFYSITVAKGFESYVGMLTASIAMSVFAEIVARLRKAPASVFLAVALIPVVPGGAMFRFVLSLLEGDYELAFTYGIQTTLEAGALAIGIIVVSSFTKVLIRKFKQGN